LTEPERATTGGTSPPSSARVAGVVAAAGTAFLVLALVSLALSRLHDHVAPIWLPNAFGMCVLLARPRREWPWLLLSFAAGMSVANGIAGDPLLRVLAFVPANLLEIVVGATLLGRFDHLGEDRPAVMARTLLLGTLVPALFGATLGSLLVSGSLTATFAHVWMHWFVSDLLGGVTILPVGLLFLTRGAHTRLNTRALPWAAATLAASAIALRTLNYPYVFVSALLLVATEALGYPLTAVTVAVASLLMSTMYALGWVNPEAHRLVTNPDLAHLPQALALIPPLILAAQRARVSEVQARYDELYNRATDGILFGTPDGGIRAANPAAERMLGRTAAELRTLGRALFVDLTDPRLRPMLAARRHDGVVTGFLRFMRADTSTFEAEVSSAMYRLPSGELVAHTFFRDVTKRLAQQRALEQSKDLLLGLSEMVPGALYTFERTADGHLRFPWSSPSMPVLFGVPHEELARSAELAFANVHPDDLPEMRERMRVSHQEMSTFACELRLLVPGAPMRWVSVHSAPTARENGTVLWHGYATDVTERRIEEEKRRVEQVRLEMAVLSGGVGTWDADLATGSVVISPVASATLGYTPGEEPRSLADIHALVHPDDISVLGDNAWPDMEGGHASPARVLRIRHKDGRWRWMEMRARIAERRPVEDFPLRVTGTLIDVSERIEGDALRAERDRADAANHAKTVFMSRMSHELRTPLNAVIGFSQLLAGDPHRRLSPTQREQLGQIQHASDHLLALINDLLDLGRIEADELTLRLEPVSVSGAVRAAVGAMESISSKHGVLVHLGPIGADLGVRADRMRLQQVMLNLLSNAIKFNRHGGWVKLAATVETSAEGAEEVVLTVADSGWGMSPEQLSQLAQPFNRLGAESGPVEGTGIGLTITRGLLARMGGELTADSRQGLGSTFRVRLPRVDAPAGPIWPGETVGEDHDSVQPAASVLRVLYAEDNAVNAILVREMSAARPGVHIEIATDGTSALAFARANVPDLLLIDMNLGDMTGLALRRSLADDPLTANIPCVALSADAMPSQVAAAQAAGFADYLTKPLKIAMLLAVYDKMATRSV
jgi:PAS domain S-box-containing protein